MPGSIAHGGIARRAGTQQQGGTAQRCQHAGYARSDVSAGTAFHVTSA
jgi:hypothetical protein